MCFSASVSFTAGTAIGAYAAYAKWFISVWCLFAAVLSVIVLLHFTNRTSRTKEPAHGMAV